MKKIITLGIAVLAVVGLTWLTIRLMRTSGKSDTELIEFSIKDIASVDKVIITDQWDQKIEVVKNEDGTWSEAKGNCIQQQNMDYVIDAIKNIEFKGYIPDNAKEKYIGLMSAQHIKVDIYTNGSWEKTWYIGPSTQDHLGQIMLLDSREYGKSDNPVIMKIKGVNGIIDPRFKADYREWMCRDIFSLSLDQIAEVDVKFNDEPQRSFRITKEGVNFNVYQQDHLLPNVDTSYVFRYLNEYKDINFNMPNYELDATQLDSIRRTLPFCELSVTESNGNKSTLNLYRIKSKANTMLGDKSMEVINTDDDLFWCELPSGQFVKCQYFHFNKILLGHVYFPSMNLEGVKTHDGIIPKN